MRDSTSVSSSMSLSACPYCVLTFGNSALSGFHFCPTAFHPCLLPIDAPPFLISLPSPYSLCFLFFTPSICVTPSPLDSCNSNVAPGNITGDGAVAVYENATVGDTVATLNASDAENSERVWSIISGNGAGDWELNGADLNVKKTLDADSGGTTSYTLGLRVRDNGGAAGFEEATTTVASKLLVCRFTFPLPSSTHTSTPPLVSLSHCAWCGRASNSMDANISGSSGRKGPQYSLRW
jgi:hypothetical protein